MTYILDNFDVNLQKVLDEGYRSNDRTGTGTLYLPGVHTEIDISERVPIPTRRKTSWKSMLKEYLWFLTGSDLISDLREMGSNVWDFWEDDSFSEPNFKKSSIGYGYGPNLINFNGTIEKVIDPEKGFNQIDYVLDLLKNNRESRRILFSFWRPDVVDSKHCKLPPCHLVYQFVPVPDESGELNKLSCCVFQRSSDMFVGNLSTNLQGAAFYTYMFAQLFDMKPEKLYHTSGNAHIYLNHIDLVKEYLDRDKPNSPILKLNKRESIYDYVADDFTLEDYNPLPRMKVPISV